MTECLRLELRLAGALDSDNRPADGSLYRLKFDRPVLDDELQSLCPVRAEGLTVDSFGYEARDMLDARSRGELPIWLAPRPSRVAFLPMGSAKRCRIYWLSPPVEMLLELCDGTCTVQELLDRLDAAAHVGREKLLDSIMSCFRIGLIGLAPRHIAGHVPSSVEEVVQEIQGTGERPGDGIQ
jgi:hypothetical protein